MQSSMISPDRLLEGKDGVWDGTEDFIEVLLRLSQCRNYYEPRFFVCFGTFETCPPILRMSVHRGRPEVAVVW